MKLSPDGQNLAFIREKDGEPTLMFADLKKMSVRGVHLGDTPWIDAKQEVISVQWIGDRRVVFSTVFWDAYFGGVSAVNCDLTEFRPLSGIDAREQLSASTFNARYTLYHFNDADHSILMLDQGDGESTDVIFPDVVKVNTEASWHERVVKNPGNVIGWGVDYAGVVRWGVTHEKGKSEDGLIYRTDAKQPWTKVPPTRGHTEAIRPIAFDASGQRLYVAALAPTRHWAIYLFNPGTGELGDLVVDDPDYDVRPEEFVATPYSRPIVSREKRRMLGVYYVTEGPRCQWVDPAMAKCQELIDKALPHRANIFSGSTRDDRVLLIFSSSDRDPGSYYVFDTGHGTLRRIAPRMPWIKPDQMANMYPIKYPARDGQVIHGYMTLPNGRPQKNLPLVVMPHGGPWVRDEWSFDPLVQLLANRGYAVLQMNYRGSPGYGAEFSRIAKHEIGRGIQDDIEDGTKWAVAHKLADPKRVAILGASYGGYSVLFALGKSPGLYRCGISIAGVADWPAMFKSASGDEYELARQYWSEHIGDPQNDVEFLRKISPVNFADAITAPLLIIQGKDDRVVPPGQARKMISALEKAGHPPESLFIAHDGHGLVSEKSRMEGFKRIEEFLAKNLGS